jgi:hypothetical protein
VDPRPAAVATVHTLLASAVAILAIIGLFGTGSSDVGDGVVVMGGFWLSFFFVLPLAGTVALGLFDWQIGRGPGILRAADAAAFVLAGTELSAGAVGLIRWLVGAIAILAATGITTSLLVAPPRRAGFRR